MPLKENDRERYNLVPYINRGDTTIRVNTINYSIDENLFLAAFMINEGLVTVPEPATWAMMIVGFGLVGFATRRREKMARVSA
jgi:archaellum biogenesis protein FlaJ (TadC family)